MSASTASATRLPWISPISARRPLCRLDPSVIGTTRSRNRPHTNAYQHPTQLGQRPGGKIAPWSPVMERRSCRAGAGAADHCPDRRNPVVTIRHAEDGRGGLLTATGEAHADAIGSAGHAASTKSATRQSPAPRPPPNVSLLRKLIRQRHPAHSTPSTCATAACRLPWLHRRHCRRPITRPSGLGDASADRRRKRWCSQADGSTVLVL